MRNSFYSCWSLLLHPADPLSRVAFGGGISQNELSCRMKYLFYPSESSSWDFFFTQLFFLFFSFIFFFLFHSLFFVGGLSPSSRITTGWVWGLSIPAAEFRDHCGVLRAEVPVRCSEAMTSRMQGLPAAQSTTAYRAFSSIFTSE